MRPRANAGPALLPLASPAPRHCTRSLTLEEANQKGKPPLSHSAQMSAASNMSWRGSKTCGRTHKTGPRTPRVFGQTDTQRHGRKWLTGSRPQQHLQTGLLQTKHATSSLTSRGDPGWAQLPLRHTPPPPTCPMPAASPGSEPSSARCLQTRSTHTLLGKARGGSTGNTPAGGRANR